MLLILNGSNTFFNELNGFLLKIKVDIFFMKYDLYVSINLKNSQNEYSIVISCQLGRSILRSHLEIYLSGIRRLNFFVVKFIGE